MPINDAHRKQIMERAMPIVMLRLQTDASAVVQTKLDALILRQGEHQASLTAYELDPSTENRSAIRAAALAVQTAKAEHEDALKVGQELGQPPAMFNAMLDNATMLLDEAGLEAWCKAEEIALQEEQIPLMEAQLQKAKDHLADLQAAAEG